MLSAGASVQLPAPASKCPAPTLGKALCLPGVGPECGIEAVAWVGEKDFVISYRHKDLCGWCYSGGEGKAAGKSCQRRIMGELGALQILVISGHEDLQTIGKGSSGRMWGPSPSASTARFLEI